MRQLRTAAEQSLPAAQASSGKLSLKFWDNEFIAAHLYRACHGFFGTPRARAATTAALGRICGGHIPEDPIKFPKKPNLQAAVYESVLLHAVASDPFGTIFKRVRDLFCLYDVIIPDFEILNIRKLLPSLRKSEVMMILKTWGIHGVPLIGTMNPNF